LQGCGLKRCCALSSACTTPAIDVAMIVGIIIWVMCVVWPDWPGGNPNSATIYGAANQPTIAQSESTMSSMLITVLERRHASSDSSAAK